MKRYLLVTAILCVGAVSSCKERNATAPDLGFIQVNPHTVEVVIPFDDFVGDVQILSGYGSPQDLFAGVVALDFGGLNVRTLVHLSPLPTSASIEGSDGVMRTDFDLSFVGARVVLVVDTLNGTLDMPVDVEVFDLKEDWHASTATWEVAVDTAGDRRPWSQPGGGPITLLGGATFDAHAAQAVDDTVSLVDTVSIAIDSAAVAALGASIGGTTGLLLAGGEPGARLNVLAVSLRLTTVPSTRPDTVVELTVATEDLTFMVDPVPAAPVGWLRVGGVPSWRSVMTLSLPRTVEGTAEACGGTAGCQVDLTEVDLNLAELVLTSRLTEPAFQPQEVTLMDVRQVLNPELLPKSPLGDRILQDPEALSPGLFSLQGGTPVSVSVTDLVREILADGAETGTVPDTPIVLFSSPEPNMIGFASFEGGGSAGAPALRLLYTIIASDVGLP